MEDIQLILFKILTNVDTAVCLFGANTLFIRGKNNRARRMLGYTLLLWGICSLVRTVVLEAGMLSLLLNPLRPVGLIGGNLFLILLLFYPIEVLLPGWLNAKRLFWLFLPDIVLTLIYIGILSITGQEVIKLTHFSDFFTYFGQFNVWFRITYIILVIVYIILLLKLIYRNEMKYIQWRNDNYSDIEHMDISWMRFYAYFLILIFITWMLNVLIADTWNFILHTIVSTLVLSYYAYKGLFHESAYPEDFFKYIHGNPLDLTLPEDEGIQYEGESTENIAPIENATFEERMPQYVETVQVWMDKEKPYLHKDFKLTDVNKVLPMNRTYLSRVFNEGIGMNFCHVVRKYRVEAALNLMQKYPNLPSHVVAERCGFSSNSIFIKAFLQEMHVSPAQYRINHP